MARIGQPHEIIEVEPLTAPVEAPVEVPVPATPIHDPVPV